MFCSDTSLYLNGRRYHYPPATFPGVWDRIEEALKDGRIIAPREVFNELTAMDDDVSAWAKPMKAFFVDPSEPVQRRAGVIESMFPPGIRNSADPWVIAEAEARGLTVVTYEGSSFGGAPTKRWHRSMTGVCEHFGVRHASLAEALAALGGPF